MNKELHLTNMVNNGYTVIDHVFNKEEVERLVAEIEKADTQKETFRKTEDLFAIRQFLKEVPGAVDAIFTQQFKRLIAELFGDGWFVVKSIYFDKPERSNWFVAWHQDLTISVDNRIDLPGFGPWTVKHNQFAVQPPLAILEHNLTIRIHLDDTDETNGALKILPGSHNRGVYRAEIIGDDIDNEKMCIVPAGGIMVMRPLLMHASGRSKGTSRRRVIHIEFSKTELPSPLLWAERLSYN